ncbi:MAG: peptidase renal dipeptidase [Firmicutes bacterium]|nr:peptidase renal dipeptidase [Bacillota bacterium]
MMSIVLSQEQEERARRLHGDCLVFDYIPPGEPIMLTPTATRVMEEGLAAGQHAGVIMGRMVQAGIDDLHDPRVRERLAAYWRGAGVNLVTSTLGGVKGETWDSLVADIARWHRRFRESGYFRQVTSVAAAEAAKQDGQVGVILNIQNTAPIGKDLEKVETLYNFGVRIIQLTYNLRNLVGDGCTERTQAGLSSFGLELVRTLNRLGIVVDLSHCGAGTVADAIEHSEAPPAFTHAFCKALVDHDRAKTDSQLTAMAERGGYLGILAVPFFLSRDPNAGLEVMLDHIDHAVGIMGVDKVGIGTDWGGWTSDVPAPLRPAVKAAFMAMGFREEHGIVIGGGIGDFKRYEDWIQITRGLVSRGYSDPEIRGILGGNFLNYFKKVVGS